MIAPGPRHCFDEVKWAWRVLDSVPRAWAADASLPADHAAGSSGAVAASGRRWREQF